MRTKKLSKPQVEYTSTGIVLGNYWGGGGGGYAASKLEAPTKGLLIAQAKQGIDDGSLDSGMGFESLIGALLAVKKTTTVEIDGVPFTNEVTRISYVGKMKRSTKNWLLNVYYNN